MEKINTISEIYAGREVFITGATGLIGKSVVEKLLRSYSGVLKIFILLREKRGKSVNVRLDDFKKNAVFDLVRKENPEALNKIIAIKGDISKIGLGICQEDLKLLKNVSFIFHIAATVRFDEPLKNAIFQNVRGTLDALRIAEQLNNLKMFVHVSTAYSNPYERVVKEELYPPCGDWKVFIKAAEKIDDGALNALWGKVGQKFPNTYTFSKHLAEYVVNSYKERLPVVVYRPAIVANAYREPVPGWYEGSVGVNGLIAAIGAGVGRIVYCRKECIVDIVPLDATVHALTAIPWNEMTSLPLKPDEDVRVYTLTSAAYRTVKLKDALDLAVEKFREFPLQKCIWIPRITYTSNYFYFLLNFYIFQLLPALLLDVIIKLTGNRPVLVHIQRKYITSLKVLAFFMFKDYYFENSRLDELTNKPQVHDTYPVTELFTLPLDNLFKVGVLGTRQFVLKESLDNLKKAKIQYQILRCIDMVIRLTFYYWIAKWFYNFI